MAYLTAPQAAKICRVDRRTLLRWLDRGLLKGHRPAGGRYRVLPSDLRQFMKAHAMPIPASLLETPRIAIVDDDQAIVRALSRLVTQQVPGAEVQTAANGFAAGMLVASFAPHVLLLDIVMPGMDGIEVCRALHAEPARADTAIIVISGNLTADNVAELGRLGVTRCLRKPCDPEQLAALLAELLPAGRFG